MNALAGRARILQRALVPVACGPLLQAPRGRAFGRSWCDEDSTPAGQHWERVRIVRKRGVDLIHDPLYNKGTAFTMAERDRLDVRGLLPPKQLDMETQADRIINEFREGVGYIYDQKKMVKSGVTKDMVRKWIMLQNLQDRNETLFYKLIMDHFTEMLQIVYTPTVGFACQYYGALFRRPRGMYFTSQDEGEMAAIAYNWPERNVDAIVVTDGSRILGLGDLGIQGIGISIGKLDLYVGAGGFHPQRVLPVVIDVGTNNEELLKNPFYMGLHQKRVDGDEYYKILDEFMEAMNHRYPKALIQFEDFENKHARNLLERYRNKYLVFNDDIQGTACSALAGLYGALAVQGKKHEDIVKQRFVVAGAGSAGLGVATMIMEGIMKQGGLSREEAAKQIWICDKDGLVTSERDDLVPTAKVLCRKEGGVEGKSLLSTVKYAKATAIVGLSGVGGLFTKEVLEAMADLADEADGEYRPIIFPMSNPTAHSECTFEEAINATGGKCVFGSGSPFAEVQHKGRTYKPSQANNSYIFPGLALGARIGESRTVSDGMLMATCEALSDLLEEDDIEHGMCYPSLENIRNISAHIAARVVMQAEEEDLLRNSRLSRMARDDGEKKVKEYIRDRMYVPVYEPLVHLPVGVEE